MGSTVAAGYASAVAGGLCGLSDALWAHLAANHWPPMSARLVPFAVEAIGAATAEDWVAEVRLPAGIVLIERATGRRRDSLSVWEAIEWLHLDEFVAALAHADRDAGPERGEDS